MIRYTPPALKVGPINLSLGRKRLGQEMPTAGQVKTVGTLFGLATATLGAGAAWVGFHTGGKERGLLSLAGYTVGIVGGLVGAFTLFGVMGLLSVPSSEIEQAIMSAEAERRMRQAPPAPAPSRPAPMQAFA